MVNNLKSIRVKKGFSQKLLAERCKVSRQTIIAIENNKYYPTLFLISKISNILKTPINEILYFEEDDLQ